MPTLTAPPASAPSSNPIANFYRPVIRPLITTDPAKIRAAYRHWEPRILTSSIVGYAVFYFVRVNLPVAMPALEKDLHLSNTDLGLFLTLHGVVYGLSKFFNGFLGDRVNAPRLMATGLLLSALANFAFGSSSLAVSLGVFWVLNGYFQGMGFPPCARLLTHWFPPHQLATKMSIWNISHQVGGFLIQLLCGFLVIYSWRLCFHVPALIALATVVFILATLKDTPQSLGLPPVETLEQPAPPLPPRDSRAEGAQGPTDGPTRESISPSSILDPLSSSPPPTLDDQSPAPAEELPYRQILRRYVFSNPYIWLVSLANFFVYTIRYAILSWAPTFLSQSKHIQLTHAAAINAAFELSGLFSTLLAGYLADKFFHGRTCRIALISMLLCTLSLYLFWRIPHQSELTAALLITATGFFVYAPQCLIGIAAANLATRRAAAAAVGLTGLFGYLSTVLSGVGLGYLVDHHGWPAGFLALIAVASVGSLLFLLAWNAPAHGYDQP